MAYDRRSGGDEAIVRKKRRDNTSQAGFSAGWGSAGRRLNTDAFAAAATEREPSLGRPRFLRLTFSPLFAAYVCFRLSSEPSHPHLFPTLPSPLPRHVLSFEVLTSERCIIQESVQHPHTHAFFFYRTHALPCLCGLAVCCGLLAERDKLSGSHFTEWLRTLVDDCFFFSRVFIGAIDVSLRRACD